MLWAHSNTTLKHTYKHISTDHSKESQKRRILFCKTFTCCCCHISISLLKAKLWSAVILQALHSVEALLQLLISLLWSREEAFAEFTTEQKKKKINAIFFRITWEDFAFKKLEIRKGHGAILLLLEEMFSADCCWRVSGKKKKHGYLIKRLNQTGEMPGEYAFMCLLPI